MKENELGSKIISAEKWASITEIAAKLVSPITNMILARILVPEAFGVIATVTMITSFSDMFTDSGFQKYLVQHEFKSEKAKHENANVAFWTNFVISMILWFIITLFREKIAILVGSPGLGNVIAIACFQLPLTSFSSIQMALYRRSFDYKSLFLVRMISVCIPFVVTIPLAILGLGYWSMIIGTIAIQISNAIILTIKSKWKPKFFYSKKILVTMFSFSIWSLIEAISIWLTTWVDSFLVGNALDQYYLGLYKTSTSMVNTLMALITSTLIPVLFSTLSRLQDDDQKFNKIFFKFQRVVSIIVFPIGVGVWLYSDLATKILLGSQWIEASGVIGVWAVTSSIQIVFGNFSSTAYMSKGRPKLSLLAQFLHLIILVPVCFISLKYGFWPFIYARSGIRIHLVVVHFIIMNFIVKIKVSEMLKNVLPTIISSLTMGGVGYLLQQIDTGFGWELLSILVCLVVYFGMLFLFKNMKNEMFELLSKFTPKSITK